MGYRRFQGWENAGGRNQPRHERTSSAVFAKRSTIAVAIACGGLLALWLGYLSVHILLVVFASIVMAVLFHTLGEPLMRYAKMPTWAAVLVAVVVVLGALVLGGWLMAAPISHQFDELSVRLPEAIDRFRSQYLSSRWTDWVVEKSNNATDGQNVLKQVTRAFSITMTAGGAILIVLFLSLYLAADPQTYVEGTIRLCPVGYRHRLREVMRELHRVLRVWLLTKLISMAFVAVCVTIGLWLMHVPLALALGIVAGLFEFIPTIGPLLSAAPAILIAFVQSPMTALYVALLYIGVQWVQNHVTNPLLQQRTLSLPAALSLALVALLGTLFGFGGLLLSGPLSVVLVVLVRMIYIEDALESHPRQRPARQHAPPRHEEEHGGAS